MITIAGDDAAFEGCDWQTWETGGRVSEPSEG